MNTCAINFFPLLSSTDELEELEESNSLLIKPEHQMHVGLVIAWPFSKSLLHSPLVKAPRTYNVFDKGKIFEA